MVRASEAKLSVAIAELSAAKDQEADRAIMHALKDAEEAHSVRLSALMQQQHRLVRWSLGCARDEC